MHLVGFSGRRSGTGRLLAGGVAILAFVLVGCSFSLGGVSMPQERLEELTADQLEQAFGVRPDTVTCPGDLKGEVGETMRCELTAGPDTLGVTIEVVGVEGEQIEFTAEVDEELS